MARFADLSLEYAHLYLRQVTEETAHEAVATTKRWVEPLLERYASRGLCVTKAVMIDDYFTRETHVVEEKTNLILDACEQAEFEPDFIVYEGGCAETVERMMARLVPEPRRGDGSAEGTGSTLREEWLSNGKPPRAAEAAQDEVSLLSTRPAAALAGSPVSPVHDGSSGPHSLHLDIELFRVNEGERLYACPTLAAWWQLIRLGMLRDRGGSPTVPARTIVRNPDVPFPAQRTLTVLSPRFLEVEHAVRTILGQVNPPPEWLGNLRLGRDEPDVGEPAKRIAYLFLPEGFDPPRLATD